MPTYVLLSTLTPEGRRSLRRNPDRLMEVNKEIEAFGCTVCDQYALLGPYDFLSIVEAQDNETIARLAVILGSRGTINMMTLAAIPRMQFHAKLVKSKQVGSN
jgi:uncharacterized protein with GYD domain